MNRKLAFGAIAAASALIAAGVQAAANAAPDAAPTHAATGRAQLMDQAHKAAPRIAKSLALSGKERLVPRDVVVGENGVRHVRYDRTYDGLRVIGGDLVVHEDAKQRVKSVTWAHKGSLSLGAVKPAVSRASAENKAHGVAQSMATERGRGDSDSLKRVKGAQSPDLIVWAASGTPALAWDTTVNGVQQDNGPSELHVVSDAATGKVLTKYEGIKGAADDKGVHVGTVDLSTKKSGSGFELKDPSRGDGSTVDLKGGTDGNGTPFTDDDDAWGTGKADDPQSAAVDAQFGAAATWDFYKKVFKRAGIFNDGKGAVSRVHYGKDFVNAFWSDDCRCMTYGDGEGNNHPLTALDVAGHEMTHGVTSATAQLVYEGESGGLNEATSDILGTGVEWHANLADDKPDYLIGEEIDIRGDGSPLRYMDKPSKDGSSADYWAAGVGDKDVHHSSGVANHFYYLLSEGSGKKTVNGVEYDSPTQDGSTVTGIGHEKAEAIWYNALTKYFTSTTDYKAARKATLKAAGDLYGADSAEAKAVAAAWTGVNVK
ncbi:M4 family metallopeptidase [Wenjunlia tyrosinilytica]|uniref:Neutral metalloproteinase n=1 Tax=Wenjunlia tyrosinilytica TaxID=1544741 RepID=A0A917ZLE7_9ACTN|nr:M4 family metallopeptidase [Wenjunlia tyrosinilytica]GGO85198.1 peptidase [Wenjunlia tyrosinilytica]